MLPAQGRRGGRVMASLARAILLRVITRGKATKARYQPAATHRIG